MSAAALLTYINNKKFLFVAAAVFIFPFILFSFWNVPSADDYMIIDKKNQFSFWQLQSSVYHGWTGRYFATFVSSAFSYSGFLYSHYYLHSLLLFSLTVFSWLFCLIQINRHLLSAKISLSSLAILSLLLLIAEINIIPEPVTAFYWFSSAVTYQLPLVILIFSAGIIIQFLFTSSNKIICFIIACILNILLNGCNEMITLFLLISSACLVLYYIFTYKKVSFYLISLFAVNIISACFLLFSPGIANRSSKLGEGSFVSAVGSAFVKFIILHWYFLKEPLWWFLVFFTCLVGYKNKYLLFSIFKCVKKISMPFSIAVYLASGLLIYIPVLYVTNGSLPVRAENIICFLYSLILLGLISIFVIGKINNASFSVFYKHRYLLFSILIFSTGNMKMVTDSLLSGYFYHSVMKERLNQFENAKRLHEHEITFDNYTAAVNKKIKEHPAANRQMLRDIIVKPPPIICFGNDLYDVNYLKELYGIKELTIRKE
jgi:hypothetical protein